MRSRQNAVLSIRMLMRLLGLHARPGLRKFVPNSTTVRSLVRTGDGITGVLRGSVLFVLLFFEFSPTPHRHRQFPPQTRIPDKIRINDLTLVAKFKDGTQWSTPSLQPVKLTLSIAHDIRASGELDDLSHTLNYASIVDTLTESSNGGTFSSLEALTDSIFEKCFEAYPRIRFLSVKATKPKALLRGKSVSLRVSRSRSSPSDGQESFSLEDIEFPILIGVNPEERVRKQMIRMNLILFGRASSTPVDYRSLENQIHEVRPLPVPY